MRSPADLATHLRPMGRVLLGYSGGIDSALLAVVASQALGPDRFLAVLGVSASLGATQYRRAVDLAARHGVPLRELPTDELGDDRYRANPLDRCYHCKKELFVKVAERRAEIAPPSWTVVYGAITDDLGDHRPGQRAAKEHGVRAPLLEAGMGKDDVRRYSRERGLRTADKPSFACLSSRVPYGKPIDRAVLLQIERAEAALRSLGLRQFRVRHHDQLARVEVAGDELGFAFAEREAIGRALQAVGYVFVALDVFGYRSGAMNALLGNTLLENTP